MSSILIGIHAVTGCGFISSFDGKEETSFKLSVGKQEHNRQFKKKTW